MFKNDSLFFMFEEPFDKTIRGFRRSFVLFKEIGVDLAMPIYLLGKHSCLLAGFFFSGFVCSWTVASDIKAARLSLPDGIEYLLGGINAVENDE